MRTIVLSLLVSVAQSFVTGPRPVGYGGYSGYGYGFPQQGYYPAAQTYSQVYPTVNPASLVHSNYIDQNQANIIQHSNTIADSVHQYAGLQHHAVHQYSGLQQHSGPAAAAYALPEPSGAYAHPALPAPVPAVPAPIPPQELHHSIQNLDVALPAQPSIEHPLGAQVTDAAESVQFHAQDELGNSEYGYRNQNSAKHEISENGVVRGSYAYRDESGHHTVNYVADDFGFRLV